MTIFITRRCYIVKDMIISADGCTAYPSPLKPPLRRNPPVCRYSLTCGQPGITMDAARITLLEGETKNDESRILPMSDSLVKLLSAVKNRERRVFPSKRAMQAAFPKACKTAKIEGLMVHDLRRSAVRNLMNAGVQQAVAMRISGHRDASVYQRYNVVDTNQTADAMERVQRLVPVKVRRALPARSARRGGSR
jgi:hypothetical protein